MKLAFEFCFICFSGVTENQFVERVILKDVQQLIYATKKKTWVCLKLSSDQCEMTNDSGDIFVGIVTALDADFGFIDGTIFFTKPRFILMISWSRQPFYKKQAQRRVFQLKI